jgi:UDP-N-acetylglucosamine--N-acetylmuramyl-(pentapeptide) pyrophosphoryl-undecaprenol N-acetylglucosamine transferase
MVLHAGTASEIAEHDGGHAHGTRRSQQEPSTPTPAGPTNATARRLLIAVGATAGHVYPALAIAEAYRAAYPDLAVTFAGPDDALAARLLAARGHTLHTISSSQLVNAGLGGKLVASGRVLAGFAQARRLLRAHGARLVLGLGGYASGAILLAARALGLRLAIHEANAVPGLANRLLAPFAHRVYLASAAAAPAFAESRSVVTGQPVRADIATLIHLPRAAPECSRATRVLVLSSTRGERFLAERVPDLLASLAPHGVAVEALHQTGQLPHEEVAHAYRRAGVKATVAPYLDEIASAYLWADVVIARSGAGTLAEIAVAGVPALLVPLGDASHDHQAANAAAFAASGAAITVREQDWQTGALATRLARLLEAPAWSAASAAARRLARPDAAARVVADCEALMTGRW